MLQNRFLGANNIQQTKVGQAVADGNIHKAQRKAMHMQM